MLCMLILRAPLLLLLAFSRLALEASAQSQVVGDLTQAAPYGIPPDRFNVSISRTVRQSAVFIPGYNLSAPEGFGPSGNGSSVVGWQLGVAVAENVPLTAAAVPGIDTEQVIDATTLWLQAPAGVSFLNSTSWELCATVFPFVNMSAVSDSGDNSNDGSNGTLPQNNGDCGPWLTDQCAAALNEAALAFGTNANGTCNNITVPHSCAPYFLQGQGSGTAAVLGERTLADGRFYAWGSAPISRNDSAALNSALDHVWPVLLTWVQFGPNRTVFAANTHVTCVLAAANGTGNATERGTTTLSAGATNHAASWMPSSGGWGLAALISIAFALLA